MIYSELTYFSFWSNVTVNIASKSYHTVNILLTYIYAHIYMVAVLGEVIVIDSVWLCLDG